MSDEFRALLRDAHARAGRCASLAISFHRTIRCNHHLSGDGGKLVSAFLAMRSECLELRRVGIALSDAHQSAFGTISKGTSPIPEHQRIVEYIGQLTAFVMLSCKMSRFNPDIESDVAALPGLFRSHYPAMHQVIGRLAALQGCFPADLDRCHDVALKEWITLSAGAARADTQTRPQATDASDTRGKNRKQFVPRNLDELKRLQRRVNRGVRQGETKAESVRDFVEETYPKLTTESATKAKVAALIRALNRHKGLLG
jgi:hypothetical protein